jgi:hypothetical protein
MAPQRLARLRGRRLRGGERYAEDRVGTEPALVRGAVEQEHRLVHSGLVVAVEACHDLGELAVRVRHRPRDALAGKNIPAVAQLDRLELAGRGTRGHGRTPTRPGHERDIHLDRRIAAAVEYLAGTDLPDLAHVRSASSISAL